MRVLPHVWNLRSRRAFRAIGRAFACSKDRDGFRLVHFSVQGDHLHLIAEARDAQRLARGMQGLATRAGANLAVARGAASIENQNLESVERVASA